ncbi:MAG: hypothetical protein PUE01_05075 [Clostridiaceae bacterium]|nr:hypothetical protein [Clostridiaceae bacterium]
MDIFKLLSGNLEGLSEDEKVKAEEFTEKLKDSLIEELILCEAHDLISKLERDKEEFIDSIDSIYRNGIKGYSKMSMQLLLNIYLEKKGNEEFVRLIENIE